MLFAKKIIRLTPFLGLVCFITPTKAQINSPFSRYGLGTEIVNSQNATSQALGGFSAAYTSSMNGSFGQSVNFNNPASYGSIYMTTFDLGLNFNNNTLSKLSSPTGKEKSTYLIPNYIVVGLPMDKNKKTGNMENIIKSHKIKIYFNSNQKNTIKRIFGVYRYFYNRTIQYINNFDISTIDIRDLM